MPRARLAQSVEHQTFNLRVMGSSPISGEPLILFHFFFRFFNQHVRMGLMHNYVIQCMRVRLGGIAKQVPPFFRECVFHFYILATNIPL